MKEDIEGILRLHKEYSARFSNYVLKSLIEENGDKKNIALSPSRLQAMLVLLANWTTPNISRWILDQAVSDVVDIKEANLFFIATIPNRFHTRRLFVIWMEILYKWFQP